MFKSPYKVQEACLYKKTKQQEQRAEELKKAKIAKLRRSNKLYKEKIAQEKHKQQVREKEERN